MKKQLSIEYVVQLSANLTRDQTLCKSISKEINSTFGKQFDKSKYISIDLARANRGTRKCHGKKREVLKLCQQTADRADLEQTTREGERKSIHLDTPLDNE